MPEARRVWKGFACSMLRDSDFIKVIIIEETMESFLYEKSIYTRMIINRRRSSRYHYYGDSRLFSLHRL